MAKFDRNLSKFRWHLRELLRQTWVRVTAFAVLGVLTAIVALLLKRFIPDDLSTKIGSDAVDSLLNVIASSMLAVTTFSLSTMVGVYSNAANNATPRVVPLLVEDSASQTILATFMGAFMFSLVGIILLRTGVYGQSGRLVLFVATVFVVIMVVVSLLRWISALTKLGRVSDNLERLERETITALSARQTAPNFGANVREGPIPVAAHPLALPDIGYIRHVDFPGLTKIADAENLYLYLIHVPGDFVHPASPSLYVLGGPNDKVALAEITQKIVALFSVGEARSFGQDPLYGAMTLSEVAQRALSPAVNDPGTAMETLGRLVRSLSHLHDIDILPDATHPRIWITPLDIRILLENSFLPIARDGAGIYQLQIQLQQALLALAKLSPRTYAAEVSDLAGEAFIYAKKALSLDHDIERLQSQVDATQSWCESFRDTVK